jgi:short-subunit dehydrogenase
VRVTVLCPGPVPTEFQARAGVSSTTFPRLLARSAERVADEGYRGLKANRAVVVPGGPNKVVTVLTRLVPRRLLLAATAQHQKRRQR